MQEALVHSYHHRLRPGGTCLETCNSRGQGGGLKVQDHPQMHHKLKASFGYMRPCFPPAPQKKEGVGGGKGQTAETLGPTAVYPLLEMQFVYERCRQVSLAVAAFQVCRGDEVSLVYTVSYKLTLATEEDPVTAPWGKADSSVGKVLAMNHKEGQLLILRITEQARHNGVLPTQVQEGQWLVNSLGFLASQLQ